MILIHDSVELHSQKPWVCSLVSIQWQVTLCDPIWQVTPRNGPYSSEMTCPGGLCRLIFYGCGRL